VHAPSAPSAPATGHAASSGAEPRDRWRLHGPRLGLGLALALLTYALFPEAPATQIPIYEVGAVAADNVIAPFAFSVPKTASEVESERADAERMTEPVFRVATGALDTARALQEQVARTIAAQGPNVAGIQNAARAYGITLAPDEAAYLAAPLRRDHVFTAVRRAFDRWLPAGIVASGTLDELHGSVVVRSGNREREVPADSVMTFSQFVPRARLLNPDPRSDEGTSTYLKLLTGLFRPTIVYDRAETDRRRDEIRRSVAPTKYSVLAGEKIVGAHEVVGRQEHEKLRTLQRLLSGSSNATPRVRRASGAVLFDLIIIALLGVALWVFRRRVYLHWRSVVVLASLVALIVTGAALVSQMRPLRPELIPVTLAAIVVSALLDQRISMIVTMIVTILIGAQAPFRGTNALFVNLVGGAAAALSVRAVTRRHQSYVWLLVTASAYLAAAIAIGLMLDQGARVIASSAGHGALNALASILLALLLLPIAESYTGIETDLTLLEWSDLNRPLMQRLSLEAPGTFAHTMVIANLADAACRAIGANALLARVGAYYHDIGKLGRPQYFVENQGRDRNPHDALKPGASAEIIQAHVRDGLALAEQHRLPRVLRNFITEHHGTGEISYFLGKARENGADVDPAQFAYPGPVPRSVETAVVMLADGVEAATRVLNEPTPPRVREVIEHMVRQRLEQGQLREAPLTLQQLETVKDEFARVLNGMYHSRIEYPRSSGGITAEFAST
jgi:putative nucleotidyltransferase with HDIG domain